MFGLDNDTIQQLQKLFSEFQEIDKAILYGSRAKGTFKPGSDIDISLIGKKLTFNNILDIKVAFDDLMLPYKMDINIFHSINNKEMIDHIKRIGKVIYNKI